jgi:gluconokinase
VLGLYALGRIDSLDVVGDMVGATHRHIPVARNVAVYERLLPIFLALPVQLEAQYQQISFFQKQMSAPPAAQAVV